MSGKNLMARERFEAGVGGAVNFPRAARRPAQSDGRVQGVVSGHSRSADSGPNRLHPLYHNP